MNRRFFLKNTLSVSVLSSLMISGVLKELILQPSKSAKGRVLVLIQLEGGNDGLNTVIPLDQYANLTKVRKNLLIPDKKILALHGTSITGLHPALSELQNLYNNKQMTIIQGVGFAHPDLSHFKAIDIWHTGYDLPDTITTGWLGRFLDEYQHSANTLSGDPPAIQIGAMMSKILQGPTFCKGMIVRDTSSFYDLVPGTHDIAPIGAAGDQLAFLRTTIVESKGYLQKVKVAAASQKNLSSMYPPQGNNSLADQLKIVAQLIGGGLQTMVYIVNIKGFDTHDNQVDYSDTTKGSHAELLSKVSTAIAAFEDDLSLMGKEDKVLGMAYSEFGRRIMSNAGYGSDHGTSAPVLLFGSALKGGISGHNPQIADKIGVSDNLPTQVDFRSVYTSVLNGWFGSDKPLTDATLMGSYDMLDLFKG